MNRCLLSLVFGSALFTTAWAQDDTVIWPLPVVPSGANTAATAAPRLDWLQRFQSKLDNAKKKPAIDLIFDGDSITDFWEGTGKAIWTQHYVPLNAFDFGISGDRTENVLWRLQHHQVDNLHPKLVVLLIGTNNLGGNTPEQIADGVKAIVNEYSQLCPDAGILVLGVFPRDEKPTDPARGKIKVINQIISQLADGKNISYLDFGDKLLQPDGTLSKDVLYDFLHPSPKGYQIWVDAIQPTIDKYFPAAAGASGTAPSAPAN
jgi:lysophospholipase L1-like esterase